MKKRDFGQAYTSKNWWKSGLAYSLFMIVFMEIFNQFSGTPMLFSPKWYKFILLWLAGGLIYGYTMHLWYSRKTNQQPSNSTDNSKNEA